MTEKKLTRNEYNGPKGKTYNYKVGEAQDWALDDVSQVFTAKFDTITESDRVNKKSGKPFVSRSLGVSDENGENAYLNCTQVFSIEFKKLGLVSGSRFRIKRTKMNDHSACTCIKEDGPAPSTPEKAPEPDTSDEVIIDVPAPTLDPIEKKIVDGLKKVKGSVDSELMMETIKGNLSKNGLDVSRAELLFGIIMS